METKVSERGIYRPLNGNRNSGQRYTLTGVEYEAIDERGKRYEIRLDNGGLATNAVACELVTDPEAIEVRLERLAQRLRREGVIFGPERDLMVDAANLLREMRTELVSR